MGFDKMGDICPDLQLLDFRSHLKSGPFATQPLFKHTKSRIARISDPHCICLSEVCLSSQLFTSRTWAASVPVELSLWFDVRWSVGNEEIARTGSDRTGNASSVSTRSITLIIKMIKLLKNYWRWLPTNLRRFRVMHRFSPPIRYR